jgi:acetylornithine deacetylase
MQDESIKLLCDLIAIDSVNPSLVPDGAGEGEIAEAIANYMRLAGLDVEVTEAAPGRPNAIGIVQGRSPGRSLIFCGHTDTVGVQGMTAPFDPVQRGGKLYGRGAQDMKGGLAAMLGAAAKVAKSGGLPSGELVVAAVIDEEYKSLGAENLVKRRSGDAAVVTEPTDLVIGVAHKGYTWVEVTTRGIAAHGSRPKEGRDAITSMGRFLSRLADLDGELQARTPHPIVGTGSLHASLISGGRELSTYPDVCDLQMERRTIIGEPLETALTEIEAILAALKQDSAEFDASARMLFGRPAYEIPANSDLPSMLLEAVSRAGHTTTCAGMTFWTDAAIIGHAGIPSVVFGPGGAGLHGLEEYVLVDEVITCRDALVELARSFCA